ncbi:MAG: hypothetical protein KA401_04490 [Anaerolineae bacterium]|nr:hypothetical protein [Anaerolineae bacterium]
MTEEHQTIYVNAGPISGGKHEYVCWIDLMGTKSIMGHSLEKAANYICRLHVAVLEAVDGSMQLYPMIDGMYVTTPSKQSMLNFLRKVFRRLAGEFIAAKEPQHRFLPKAAISYGPVVHGKDITEKVNKLLYEDKRIRDSLLLGIPVIAASQGERNAPPFGVFVDQSARIFAPSPSKPLPYVWYKWFGPQDSLHANLKEQLESYFDWCAANSRTLTYPPDRIKEHRAMAVEYFG